MTGNDQTEEGNDLPFIPSAKDIGEEVRENERYIKELNEDVVRINGQIQEAKKYGRLEAVTIHTAHADQQHYHDTLMDLFRNEGYKCDVRRRIHPTTGIMETVGQWFISW
jgi:hypothetical protein